ncbi:hypothetical protein [Tenacibaculum sp. M341]|uniref:hypothetical protein n=1 Tax=Tenacibaculum sp. M341 TaxID=2530339 RepID=UPI0010489157|nr:hypothetical protein [Tenacibaculum sp. M341]TCI92793.1 hypothetical protein EYW44_07815 [Tenacibaculum sp. M341]
MEITENISQITNPELDLNRMTVLGIRLGDSRENIPIELITEGSHGDWLHTTKGITIRISKEEPKKVVEFLLNPEILEDLKITKEKRIEKRFGKTISKEKKIGSTFYFYENQKIVVGWDKSDDKLFGIYVGNNIIKQTKFRINDFLDKFYEFKGMVPNPNEWNARSLKYNEPRFYRFKELEALMRAFEIGKDLLKDFQNRNFLNNRSIDDFQAIIDDIEKYVVTKEFEKKRWQREKERLTDVNRFGMLIQSFMRFSEETRNLLRFNSGWLETGSVTSRYSIYKTQKLLDNIDLSELNEIEALLGKLLDPKERIFTKSELIKNYKFPDVDLHSIDMENY